jgi:hypothetical protein
VVSWEGEIALLDAGKSIIQRRLISQSRGAKRNEVG